MTLREAAQQALEALEQCGLDDTRRNYALESNAMIALRAALAEPVQSGSCIACGNRMTGSPESFVVATAEVGATAPEGYRPQQVEALHPNKGGDKTSPPLAEPVQSPVGDEWEPCVKLPVTVHVRAQRNGETHVSTREGITPIKPDDLIMRGVSGEEYPIGREIFERTYQRGEAPPQRKPLTEEGIRRIYETHRASVPLYHAIARAIEKAHGIGGGNE